MADPFRKLTRGERLPGIPGEAWNAFIDAAKFTKAAGGMKAGAPAELKATPNCVIALVRNNTGADVDRFSVLGLGDPLILPTVNEKEFQNKLAFEGNTPSTTDHAGGRFAVTLYPIRDGEIGKAVIAGAVPIKIKTPGDPLNIDAADIEDGEASHLITASGGARVLWIQPVADAGAGADRWAIVVLGGGADKTVVVKITGKSGGGGKYLGRIMKGTSTGATSGDLAMPEGLEDPGQDNALVFNAAEDTSDKNRLINGTYHIGQIVGPADSPLAFRVVIDVPVPPQVVYHGKIKDDYVLGDNSVKVWRCSDESGSDAVEVKFDLTDPRQAAMSAAGWESENLVTVKLRHPIDAIGLSESLGLKAGRVIAFVADGVEIKDYEDYGIPGEPGNCIDYLLNAGTPDEVSVHECNQTVLTGAALPTEAIKVYGKANADWAGGNTISVNLCDRAGTEYSGPSGALTFAAYINSPESGSGQLFCSIAAGQILALEEMAPGVFHCVNVVTSDGKLAVNKSDTLDFLEKQMVGDEVYTKTKTVTGDDMTPVVQTYHIAGKSVDKDTLVTVGVTVVGDTVTVTPKILHRDGADHLRDWEVGTPISFTRSGGSEIEGDGIWTDTKDTSDKSHPARKQVFHINTAGADAKFDLVVGAVDVDHTDPDNAVYVWTPLLVHRDGTKHLESIEDNPAGEVTLTGDGIHIQIDDDGKIKHMDADLANEVVAVNVIQGFEIVDVGGLKHMRITFIGIHYDAGGHIVGIDPAESLDLPLTILSVDTQTSWDSTAKVLRKKTQVIGVPYAELPSSYITILSGSKCAT